MHTLSGSFIYLYNATACTAVHQQSRTTHTMIKYPMLLLSIPLVLCLPAVWMIVAAGVPQARSGCQTRCGGVDIPYPFGIGDQCAINHDFSISCMVINPYRPLAGQFEVTKLSVGHAKAWVTMNMSRNCGDPNARQKKEQPLYIPFDSAPFRFSNVDNKMFVIGYNTFAFMIGVSYNSTRLASTGCSATCFDSDQPKNGTCSGAGCCEADVPKGLESYRAYYKEIGIPSKICMRSSCSYMVVMQKSKFNYSTTYIYSTTFWDNHHGQVPVVLDWTIESDTCKAECISDNSECVESTSGRGYRCKCRDGYQGNPYDKQDGCKDIDECLDSTTYPCGGICKNTQGNFTCSCPAGKDG